MLHASRRLTKGEGCAARARWGLAAAAGYHTMGGRD